MKGTLPKMKSLFSGFLAIILLSAFTPVQDTIYVHWKTGNLTKLAIADIDSLNFSYDYSTVNPHSNFKQDSVFNRIYSTLSVTGTQMPAGNPDVVAMDEGLTSFVRCIWNLNELSTDEAICSWADPFIPDLNFNKFTPSNEQIKGMYLRLYFNIGVCNYFLENTISKTDANSVKQRAEARFIRALNYFYLLDMFGNVPLITSTNTTNLHQVSRTELFTWIESELSGIEPDMYAVRQAPYPRADVVANWLLLSRLYLNAGVYTGTTRWNDAAVFSKKVIDSGYVLTANYKHLFMADNAGTIDASAVNKAAQEIILPVVADGVTATTWGSTTFLVASTHSFDMAPWGSNQGWSGNRARATLIHKFYPATVNASDISDLTTGVQGSTKDARALFNGANRSLNITDVSSFNQGYSVTKFSNVRADGQPAKDAGFVDTDFPLLRVAEAYLNYAEAVIRGGNSVSGYSALTAINVLRQRAGASVLLTADLQIVLDEKCREFFFEGQRRTDLIRFDKFGGNTDYSWDWKNGTVNGTTFPVYLNVFPIPQAIIENNPALYQNVGY